jgi:hypothetical protein
MEKITKRDMYKAIIEFVGGEDLAYPADDVVAFCEAEINILDKKAEAAKARAEAKRAEGDALQERIFSVLSTEEFMTVEEILAALDDEDLSSQKIIPRLNNLFKFDKIEKEDVTTQNSQGKNKKKVGYKAI